MTGGCPVAQLGSALASACARGRTRVAIVAHSMGDGRPRGAALAGTGNVERLVLLGTPSLRLVRRVQAVRGHLRGWCGKVARLAGEAHSAESLAARSSALSEPAMTCCPSLPAAAVPICSRCARMACLRSAAARGTDAAALAARQRLAPPMSGLPASSGWSGDRHRGSRGATTTSSTRSRATATAPCRRRAPRSRALRSVYARVAHSNLTRDPVVAAAVVDMLRRGSTTRLPAAWLSSSRACTRVSDRQLRRSHAPESRLGRAHPESGACSCRT